MLLASVQEIREQLGFDDMTDINFAVTMAMHAIEPQLASRLNTDFARGEAIDVFWVPEPTFREGSHHETHFRLSKGFVHLFTAVRWATSASDLATGCDLSGDIKVDYNAGVVRDWTSLFERTYVEFTYSFGFEANSLNANSYDLMQVPVWLQQAAKISTLIAVADSPSLTEANIRIDTKMLKTQLDALLGQHLRYAPLAYLPM